MTGLDNPAAQGGAAIAASMAIQYLKNAGWASWFTRETAKANLGLSLVIAFLTSVGIHWTWDPATDTIGIIGVAGFFKHGLWEWIIQWIGQHASYKGLVVPAETLGEIRALLQRVLEPPPVSEGAAKAEGVKP